MNKLLVLIVMLISACVSANDSASVLVSLTKVAPSPYEEAAKTGDPISQYMAALSYEMGIGTPVNFYMARSWYKKASDNKFPPATRKLAHMTLNGVGGPSDAALSVRLFEEAASLGDAVSQNMLGYLFGNGVVVKQDYSVAFKWFKVAASKGSPLGEYNLALCYLHGYGTPVNTARGEMWANRAYSHGVVEAKSLLDTGDIPLTPQAQ